MSVLGFQDISEFENGWTWQPTLVDMALQSPLWGLKVRESPSGRSSGREVHGSWCIFLKEVSATISLWTPEPQSDWNIGASNSVFPNYFYFLFDRRWYKYTNSPLQSLVLCKPQILPNRKRGVLQVQNPGQMMNYLQCQRFAHFPSLWPKKIFLTFNYSTE